MFTLFIDTFIGGGKLNRHVTNLGNLELHSSHIREKLKKLYTINYRFYRLSDDKGNKKIFQLRFSKFH